MKQVGSPFLDQKKVDSFWAKMQKLADKTFGKDDDDDSFLEVNLVDRTRFERPHFHVVPYDHKCETEAEHNHRLEVILLNLTLAWSRFELEQKLYQSDKHQEKRERAKLREVEDLIYLFASQLKKAPEVTKLGDEMISRLRALQKEQASSTWKPNRP